MALGWGLRASGRGSRFGILCRIGRYRPRRLRLGVEGFWRPCRAGVRALFQVQDFGG